MMTMDILIKPKIERNYSPDLLSWEELSNLLNNLPLMTMDRFIVKLPEDYARNLSWSSDMWTTDKRSIPSFILKDIIERYVCYIKEMSRSTRKINDFAKSIEDEYSMPTDAHIYMCKNVEVEHPFGIHFDRSHNIIVQCEGETNFKVWDKVDEGIIQYEQLGMKQDSTNLNIEDDPLLNIDMKPGDAIWVPAYHPHLATSITPRMSVSFPFINKNKTIQNREWIQL